MMISGIEPLDRRRSKVFLDGSFAFVLYNGELRRFSLQAGGELGEKVYREIMDDILCRRARERMLHMLETRPRTEAEIRRKLKEGFFPAEAIHEVVAFALRCGYIDDEDYARRYFEVYGDKKSRRQMAAELKQKGIGREITEALLEEESGDEAEKAAALLRKRRWDPENADAGERRRAAAFLARRGFSGETISRAMEHFSDFEW